MKANLGLEIINPVSFILEVSQRFFEGVWKVSEEHQEGFCKLSGRCLHLSLCVLSKFYVKLNLGTGCPVKRFTHLQLVW